jgi:CheY-like chemotaxis protein
MARHFLRLGLVLGLAFVAFAAAPAQEKGPPKNQPPPRFDEDYRQFFKKPQTVQEFWDALQFEIEVGRYDLAAGHLHALLAKKPGDQELIDLHDKYGMAAFLRLRNIRNWSDNAAANAQAKKDVDEFIQRVTTAVQKKLSDPKRIELFVRNLSASPEERAYALRELYRSGAQVIPYLIDALRKAEGADKLPILRALQSLVRPETVPPLVAALDSNEPELQIDLIDIFQKRATKEVVPYLWSLAALPSRPEAVRRKATAALAQFLDVPASRLPPAKAELTRQAEQYYQHRVAFANPDAVTVWRWDGQRVVAGWPGAPVVPASKAEEYYGLRFARQALEIDPSYRPAQVVLASLALEKAAEQGGPAQPLSKAAPAVNALLGTAGGDLLNEVLERAIKDRRTPVVLGAVRLLGEKAEVSAVRPRGKGEPPLVQALNYPDRRVQMAAVSAILRIPAAPSPPAATRLVEVLARALAAKNEDTGRRKVMAALGDEDWRGRVRAAVAQAGADPVPVETGRDALRRLRAAADIDLILLDSTLPDPGLAPLLGQLRADVYSANVPVVLIAVPEGRAGRDLALRYRAAQARLRVIHDSTRSYRKALADVDAEYADRAREIHESVKMGRLSSQASEDALKTINERHEARRKDLARDFPESATLLKDVPRVEQEMRALTDRYDAEGRRREEALRRFVERKPNVTVVSTGLPTDADRLRALFRARFNDPDNPPLSPAELQEYAGRAIRQLADLAEGVPPGYDVTLAADAVLEALRAGKLDEEGQRAALVVAGRLPGPKPQTILVDVILDGKRPAVMRSAAVAQLVRQIQARGPALDRAQLNALAALYRQPGIDAGLRTNLALVLGSLRPDARVTGERLRRYEPAPPGAPAKEKPAPPPKDKG